MANLGYNFDANDVEPNAPHEIIPAGKYPAQIVDSVMKDTKAGTGQYLELVLEIVDGEFAGRKLWDRLNLKNPNQKAEEIAHRTLSAICRAVNVLNVQDSEELHHRPMLVTVAVRKRDTGDLSNEVKGYEALSGAPVAPARPQPAAAAAAYNAAPTPPPTTNSSPPWRRSA